MKRRAVQLLLRALRRYFQTIEPVADNAEATVNSTAHTADGSQRLCADTTTWKFERLCLRPGWYMLEVEHTAQTIGFNFTLTIDQRDEHLLLSSKSVCKRIIHISTVVNQCSARINSRDSRMCRMTLVGLSHGFATSRIRQRLTYKSNDSVRHRQHGAEMYGHYQQVLHRHCQTVQYVPEDSKQIDVADEYVPVSVPDCERSALRPQISLKLLPTGQDHQPSNESMDVAIRFALASGWDVQWADGNLKPRSSDSISAKTHEFLMPVFTDAHYRQDVLCRLMSCVTPSIMLVYADHDHIDSENRYHTPALKPQWNPELLLNQDYIGLPWIISSDWLASTGEPAMDSVQACNAALLAAALGICKTVASNSGYDSERDVVPLRATQVAHIPHVLATVRMNVVDSDSGVMSALKTNRHRLEAVDNALLRAGSSARVVEGLLPGTSRVLWPMPDELPTVDIIIPTRDQVHVLKKCVESIFSKTDYSNYRILLVDNDSQQAATHRYYEALADNPRIELMKYSDQFNYSAMNNAAVRRSDADIVVLLNNDTEVMNSEWLSELIRQAIRPGVGCVGAKLHYSNGNIQHGGVVLGITGIAGHAHRYQPCHSEGYLGRLQMTQNYSAVTAACLAVSRATYELVGGLDEQHLAVAWNDVDFCLKVQGAGLRNLWTPYAQLYHHEGLSRGADNSTRKINRARSEFDIMKSRWVPEGHTDPAYHAGLTKDAEDFSLSTVFK